MHVTSSVEVKISSLEVSFYTIYVANSSKCLKDEVSIILS